jgi:hypothetical protein
MIGKLETQVDHKHLDEVSNKMDSMMDYINSVYFDRENDESAEERRLSTDRQILTNVRINTSCNLLGPI